MTEPALSCCDESRGNGTALSGNSSKAFDASLQFTASSPACDWQALAWSRRRRFDSLFTAIDAVRTIGAPRSIWLTAEFAW